MSNKITQSKYKWLQTQVREWEEESIVTSSQRSLIMDQYESLQHMTVLQFVLLIGGLLTGLGVLTLLATTFSDASLLTKIMVLALLVGSFTLVGHMLKDKQHKTARGFFFLSSLLFSFALIYINEIGGFFENPLALYPIWLLGISPFLIMDRYSEQFVLAGVLSTLVLLSFGDEALGTDFMGNMGYGLALLLPLIYIYWNSRIIKAVWLQDFSVILTFISILSFANKLNFYDIGGLLICYGLSFLYFYKSKVFSGVAVSKGLALNAIGVFGFILSLDHLWYINGSQFTLGAQLSLYGTLAFFVYALKKNMWISGVWVVVLIARVYFDTLFDLLPKGLFFTLGGLGLLIAGYILEKLRKSHKEVQ